MSIPIANLYFLLCYAWDKLVEKELVNVRAEDQKELHDLLSRVLVNGTTYVLRRGIDRGYVAHDEPLRSVRGRVDVPASIKQNLIGQTLARCRYDELSEDVLHNQIVKTTILSLIKLRGLDPKNRRDLKIVIERMTGVSEITLRPETFRRVQLHRNIAVYRLLLDVCELIHDCSMIEPDGTMLSMREFVGNAQQMGHLFQKFVFNFYQREQDRFDVRTRRLRWRGVAGGVPELERLPVLEPDVLLSSRERTIIIECKFYEEAFQRRRSSKEKVRSDHLYQLLAYLDQLDSDSPLEGWLCYPTVTHSEPLRYNFEGVPITVQFVDLNVPWRVIHRQMLSLLDERAAD